MVLLVWHFFIILCSVNYNGQKVKAYTNLWFYDMRSYTRLCYKTKIRKLLRAQPYFNNLVSRPSWQFHFSCLLLTEFCLCNFLATLWEHPNIFRKSCEKKRYSKRVFCSLKCVSIWLLILFVFQVLDLQIMVLGENDQKCTMGGQGMQEDHKAEDHLISRFCFILQNIGFMNESMIHVLV